MKSVIHVNQHIVKSNKRTGERIPPLTVKSYKHNLKATEAKILDATGAEVARVVYRPDDPLPCGATCWIETACQVETA